MIDEATDIATDKNLCVDLCVRYFSVKNEMMMMMTVFLGLVQVIETTGQLCLRPLNHSYLCLICGEKIASDMAVMVPVTWWVNSNSLWSRIHAKAPNCQLMKCMCHSLALCIQKGFDKLPSSLGFLLKEIPKWFSKSTLRRDTCKDLFKVMSGSDIESSAVSTPFTKISTTRWLVRGKVLYDILTKWEELKAYFTCASVEVRVAGRTCVTRRE